MDGEPGASAVPPTQWQLFLPRDQVRANRRFNVAWCHAHGGARPEVAADFVALSFRHVVVAYFTNGPPAAPKENCSPKEILVEPGMLFVPAAEEEEETPVEAKKKTPRKAKGEQLGQGDTERSRIHDIPRRGRFNDNFVPIGKAAEPQETIVCCEWNEDNVGAALLSSGSLYLLHVALDCRNSFVSRIPSSKVELSLPEGNLDCVSPMCLAFRGTTLAIGAQELAHLSIWEIRGLGNCQAIGGEYSAELAARLNFGSEVWATAVCWVSSAKLLVGLSNGRLALYNYFGPKGTLNECTTFSYSSPRNLSIDHIKHRDGAVLACQGNEVLWFNSLRDRSSLLSIVHPGVLISGVEWINATTILATSNCGRLFAWRREGNKEAVDVLATYTQHQSFAEISEYPVPLSGFAVSPNATMAIGLIFSGSALHGQRSKRVKAQTAILKAIRLENSFEELLARPINSTYCNDIAWSLLKRPIELQKLSHWMKHQFNKETISNVSCSVVSISLLLLAYWERLDENAQLGARDLASFVKAIDFGEIAQWQRLRYATYLEKLLGANVTNSGISGSQNLKNSVLTLADAATYLRSAFSIGTTKQMLRRVLSRFGSARDLGQLEKREPAFQSRAPNFPAYSYDEETFGLVAEDKLGFPLKRDMFTLEVAVDQVKPARFCSCCGCLAYRSEGLVFPSEFPPNICVLCSLPLYPMEISTVHAFENV